MEKYTINGKEVILVTDKVVYTVVIKGSVAVCDSLEDAIDWILFSTASDYRKIVNQVPLRYTYNYTFNNESQYRIDFIPSATFGVIRDIEKGKEICDIPATTISEFWNKTLKELERLS